MTEILDTKLINKFFLRKLINKWVVPKVLQIKKMTPAQSRRLSPLLGQPSTPSARHPSTPAGAQAVPCRPFGLDLGQAD